MMLLTQFTSQQSPQKRQGFNPIKSIILVLSFYLLSACSSQPNSDAKTSTLSHADTDLVDMVNLGNGASLANQTPTLAVLTTGKNRYLDQANAELADLPAPLINQYKQALTMMQNQQWVEAERGFDQIIRDKPKLSGPYVNKALIALHQDDLSTAEKHLTKALNISKNNPYAHQILAQVYRQQGKFTQAEQHYRHALAIWPAYPQAQVNLAMLLEMYRGELLQARQYYLAYLTNNPNDEQAKRWVAGIELKIKRAGLTLPDDSNIIDDVAEGI